MMMGATGALTDQQKDFIVKVKSNADRLSVLVDDLLNISRLDAGREHMTLGPVDVGRVLESVISNLQSRAEHDQKQPGNTGPKH